MPVIAANGIALHYDETGDPAGRVLILAHALGLDLRVWDAVVPRLAGFRVIRFDLRGHGSSTAPPPPYFMGDLVADAAALIAALDARDAVFVGLSLGGVVAQGLAAEHPRLVRAVVLANTAARIGTTEMWETRARAVTEAGIGAVADTVLQRWFPRAFQQAQPATVALWRARLLASPVAGYAGCCLALADTDLRASTATLSLPVLAIAGAEDGATPADLVRETAASIAGAHLAVIPRAGHLPCIDAPDRMAALIVDFVDGLEPAGGA